VDQSRLTRVRSRRRRASDWFISIVWALGFLVVAGLGARSLWETYVTLPATYARLEAAGVPATAVLQECRAGLGGGRGVGCRVSLDFRGAARTWDYPENSPQFDGLRPGAPIPMLVDPARPDVAYTVVDVRARTNTGLPSGAFGEMLLLIGAVGLLLGFQVDRALWRLSRFRKELASRVQKA
jgi:hypothetical protein